MRQTKRAINVFRDEAPIGVNVERALDPGEKFQMAFLPMARQNLQLDGTLISERSRKSGS